MFEKDHSGCILEGDFKDGKSGGKETSETGLVQVRNKESSQVCHTSVEDYCFPARTDKPKNFDMVCGKMLTVE